MGEAVARLDLGVRPDYTAILRFPVALGFYFCREYQTAVEVAKLEESGSQQTLRWGKPDSNPRSLSPTSTFARAREPSRIVDGDLEAVQIVDAEIKVRT
jgi:hypothetical protein